MVLKRLFATALGALGLGALVVGTASGQTAGDGNIPAPDIFNDQITCSMNVPTMNPMPTQVPMGGMTSPLDDLIGMGTTEIETDSTAGGFDDAYNDLGYVIPPMGANCGLGVLADGMTDATTASFVDGFDSNGDGDFDDTGDVAPKGAIPADVAAGYSDLLDKFVAVYGNPGGTTGGTARNLADAQKDLSDQIEAGTTGTALETYQAAVTRAQEAHNKAMDAFNAASGGPIYQAGVAEWMAKAAVTQSVADYNTQVGKTNTALTELNAMNYAEYTNGTAGRSKYVPLANSELTTTVVTIANDGMGTVVDSQLIQYTNSDLSVTTNVGMAAVPAMGTTDAVASDSTNSNFDSAGRLIVPMEPWDHDSDGTTAQTLRTTVNDTNTITAIRTTVENVRIAAAAIKKARDEYVGTQQDIYDEAYRRAKLELDYYEALWTEVLADTTDTRSDANKLSFVDTDDDGVRDEGEADNPNYQANPVTIASRNAAYISESNKRLSAEQDLRSKVAAREMATMEVVNQFTAPQAFYSQLVARRMALKAEKDMIVADADNPTDAQRMAASDAAKALTEAETKKAEFDALYADPDDPKVALVNELLKNDGDDGQALVDAISSNYGTANEAKETADRVAASVEGLTGDQGAVSMNTTRSMQNESDIEALDGRVAMNEGEIWDADGNSRIDANETRSMENRTMIGENRGMIVTNAENIMANSGRIDQNEMDIMTNAGNIMDNRGMIDANAADIMMNTSSISDNASAIGRNESAINGLRGDVSGLQDQMEVVRAGVAASMALAGMPAINGRGVSIGVGSYDGESAFAVGFQIQGEMASFKVGVTSAGGETGASAGVGFQF